MMARVHANVQRRKRGLFMTSVHNVQPEVIRMKDYGAMFLIQMVVNKLENRNLVEACGVIFRVAVRL